MSEEWESPEWPKYQEDWAVLSKMLADFGMTERQSIQTTKQVNKMLHALKKSLT